MAEPQANYERRQGMRARGGWVWSTWQPCTEAEARRVTGLHSWQVRQYGLCAACAGTGRAPLDGPVAPCITCAANHYCPEHNPAPVGAPTWDASQIKQPGWHHVEAAFIEGAREARANPDADEAMFRRAADGYTKRLFEEVDPVSEAALRTESWRAPDTGALRRELVAASITSVAEEGDTMFINSTLPHGVVVGCYQTGRTPDAPDSPDREKA